MGKSQSKVEKTVKSKRKSKKVKDSWDGTSVMWKSSSGHHTVMVIYNDDDNCKTQTGDDTTVKELNKVAGDEKWMRTTEKILRKL